MGGAQNMILVPGRQTH